MYRFAREEMIIGSAAVEQLRRAHVAVFGVGGVGGYIVEALARAGVGELTLIDGDTVDITNINRQIIALESTLGMDKVEVAAKRVRDINPQVRVTPIRQFFTTDSELDFSGFDYVADAIDSIGGKVEIIERAKQSGVPVISAMGAGNKLDPTAFRVTDISKTKMDPLSRIIRQELRKRGIEGVKVVYSEEQPIKPSGSGERTPGSVSFVPSVMGLIMAGEIVKDITAEAVVNDLEGKK